MTNKQFLKKIEESKTRIAKERDKLRDLIGEIEGLADNCDTAVEDLEHAADSLSELV